MDKTLAQAEGKLYEDKAIYLGTFLGGPLVATYMLAENYKKFGMPEKSTKVWIIGIVSVIVLFTLMLSVPDDIAIPNLLIPAIMAGIVYGIVKATQAELIKNHTEAGGEIYGWGRNVLVAIIGIIVTIIVMFAAAYVMDMVEQEDDNFESPIEVSSTMKLECQQFTFEGSQLV